ncbi:MAG: hypothetical protein HOH19_14115, partial [Kordiimonadaceae bacterium]|nr:hypothetical protein [Kordiimonadaceae bacterium]
EKFVNPGHLIGNLEYFYLIDGIDNNIIYIGGVIHMIVVFAFLAGMWKRYTYGFMMVAHGLSTIVSWRQYTTDFNIVFYTAWPMLAACVALYILRDLDVKYTLKNPHNQA